MNTNDSYFSIVITWLMSSACVISTPVFLSRSHFLMVARVSEREDWFGSSGRSGSSGKKWKRNKTSKMQIEEKRRREKEMAKHARSFHHPRWNESEIITSRMQLCVLCVCTSAIATYHTHTHTCCPVDVFQIPIHDFLHFTHWCTSGIAQR